MRIQVMRAGALVASLAAIVACGSDGTGPSSPPVVATTDLLSVMPPGGSTGVSTTGNMVMTFDHPMMVGMEQYLDLHRGASGPIEPIGCTWSSDRLTVTCQPAKPLQHNSQYTFHAGGGMMDADDHPSTSDHMERRWVDSGSCRA